MDYKELPTSLVKVINPIDVQNYARAMGWNRVEDIAGEIAVYRRPDSELDEIIVPQNPDFADFSRRMAEAIFVLGEYENRSPLEVLNDLLISPSDVLRFRLTDTLTENGSVPFLEGLNLLTGAKKTLLASACSVIQPQQFHPRMSRSEVEAFINNCRLGQTERGSFVATVICPLSAGSVESNNGQHSLFPEDPAETFTRQVTKLLMRSVDFIVRSINKDRLEHLVNPSEGELIISANLYEALLEMQPSGEKSSLDITTTWARTAPLQTDMPNRIRIRKEYFSTIENVAIKLRPKVEPKLNHFIGKIDALNGDLGPDGKMHREVVFAFQADDELLKARLDLNSDDYTKACDAHKNVQYVSVTGVLHRGSRIHRIHEYKDFRVIHVTGAGS